MSIENLENVSNSDALEHEWWKKETETKPSENAENYISRVFDNISASLIIDSIDKNIEENKSLEINWEEVEPVVFEKAKKLFNKIPERMPIKELQNELNQLKNRLGIMVNGISDNVNGKSDYFEHTIRERNFSKKEKHGSSPLVKEIFNIRYLTEENKQELLKNILDNKKILLLGGGNSINDFLEDSTIKPDSVINIDPFISSEPIEKNKNTNYRSILMEAQDPNLEKENIQADEIWASYSVPLYLETGAEIEQLFKNIDHLLAPGGILRIYPISLMNFTGQEKATFAKAEDFDARAKSWLTSVVNLLKTENYNLNITDGAMYLQKLAK